MKPDFEDIERLIENGTNARTVLGMWKDHEAGKGKRGTRLSENWQPLAKDWNVALDRLGKPHAIEEIEKFRDYWKAQPGQRGIKLDWDATWRNWIRNAKGVFNGTAPTRPDKSLTDNIRRELAELEGSESADLALSARPVLLISR